MSLRIRRGTEAQRTGVTLELGEIVWTTDYRQLWVGDGLQPGGYPVVGANVAGYGLSYNSSSHKLEVAGLTTDDVVQGTNNRYFSAELAQDAAATLFNNGSHTGITFQYDDTSAAINAVVTLDTSTTNSIRELAQDSVWTMLRDGTHANIAFTYTDNGTATGTINATVTLDGIGITSVQADTSPSLGGNLTLNSNNITGTGNISIAGFVDSDSVSTGSLNTDIITATNAININYTEVAQFNGRNILLSNASAGPSANEASALIIQSSRGTVSIPTSIQLADKVASFTGSGWDGTDYATLGGISIGASTGTTGTESLPGLVNIFARDDNGSFDSFAQLDGNGVFTAKALQTFGLTTVEKIAIINKYGGVGTGEQFVKGTIVYDTTSNRLSVFHPNEGWGDVLTSTSPVSSSSYFKVGVFADDTARNTAVGTPSAGMIVFNTTSGKFEGYDGSAWVALN